MQERRFLYFVAATALALVVFWSPFLLAQGSFFYTDTTFWLEPQCRFLADSIRHGHLPLWNPYNYCGMPQIAVTFPGLFYPPDYLFVLFPFNPALALSMIFHQLLAALSMYWFLRGLSLPRRGAVCGAWLYGLSGYMFALSSNHSLVAGAAYLPLAAACLHKLTMVEERLKYRYTIFSALSLCLLVLSGRPEVFIPSLLVIALFLGFKFFSARIDRTSLLWLFRAYFLAFTFMLPMLLCTGEWLPVSRRGNGMLGKEVFMYSANWYDFLSMLIGSWLGDLRLQGSAERLLVMSDDLPPFLSCAFVGPFALGLSLFALSGSRRRLVVFSLLVLTVSSLAALGGNTPVAPYLTNLFPALSVVRFPVKLMFLPVFALSILSAIGLESLLRDFTPARAKIASGSALCLAVAAMAAAIFTITGGSTFASLGSGLIVCAGVLGLLAVAAYLVGLGKLSAVQTSSALLAAIFVSLMGNAFLFERLAAPPGFFAEPSAAADRLKEYSKDRAQSRYLNLCFERLTLPAALLCGDARKDIVEQFRYQRQVLKPNTNIDFDLPSSFGFEGAMKGDFYYYLLQTYLKSSQAVGAAPAASDIGLSRFCEITGSEYLVSQCYRNEKGAEKKNVPLLNRQYFQCLLDDGTDNIRIYRHGGTHPGAWFTENFRVLKDHNGVLKELLGESEQSLVSAPLLEAQPVGFAFGGRAGSEPKPVSVERPTEEKVILVSENERAGLLVLSDQNYPGWQVSVDGKKDRIYTVNGFMRGVYLSAGRHKVVYSYEPDSLKLGLMLFALGVFLAVYLGFKKGQ